MQRSIIYVIETGCNKVSRILFLSLIASIILITRTIKTCIMIRLIIRSGQLNSKIPRGRRINGNKNNTEINEIATVILKIL